MEEIEVRHRKEQRNLQSQSTQKKKSASKKNRKAVNNECDMLEREMRERHAKELALARGHPIQDDDLEQELESRASLETQVVGCQNQESDDDDERRTRRIEESMEPLRISKTAQNASSGGAPRKPSRQKARLARRAAEQEAQINQAEREATDLPDLREQETVKMADEMQRRSLREQEIRPDGHCLYSAIADQLTQLHVDLKPSSSLLPKQEDDSKPSLPAYKIVRQTAASYMSSNPDNFAPFLEEPMDEYLVKIRDTAEWGGQLELSALAKAYGIEINVLQSDGTVHKIESQGEQPVPHHAWLAYYRHHFGLGEHYNSLRADP